MNLSLADFFLLLPLSPNVRHGFGIPCSAFLHRERRIQEQAVEQLVQNSTLSNLEKNDSHLQATGMQND